jgi:drug/metabolite transporter (DMT)-like permease
MEAKKPYLIALITQLIYTGMFVVTKAAFNHGINTFVFIFYRQAAASILMLPIALLLERYGVVHIMISWVVIDS